MMETTDKANKDSDSSGPVQTEPSLELRHTQAQGFYSYRAEQWNRLARNGNAMFPWHTFCILVDMVTGAVVFVYGWLSSSAPWPFIIPAIGYVGVDIGLTALFVALGPVPIMSSPVHKAVGPIQASQQTFFILAAVFLPASKKPFGIVWPMLIGCTVIAFTTRTLATMSVTDINDPQTVKFEVLRHGVLGGGIAAIRILDSLTDLQVGAILVQQARDAVCTWKGQEASCNHMLGLAIAQIIMAVIDYLIGGYLQQNDMKMSAETAITRTKLAVHLTSLVCEVGMMCIYIISSTYLRGGSNDMSGTVFFANLYGMGRMLMGILRASAKVRDSIASAVSSNVSKSRMSHVAVLPSPTPRPPRAPQQRPANSKAGRIWWSASTKQGSTKEGQPPTELPMDLEVGMHADTKMDPEREMCLETNLDVFEDQSEINQS